METSERFWSKVTKSTEVDGCWIWQGTISKQGYGMINVDHKNVYAHRYSLVLAGVEIPAGRTVDHICRNRPCIRPSHLEVVTQRVNILRGTGQSAINAAKTHCPKGHPYNDVNTWVDPRRGSRNCKECRRQKDRANLNRLNTRDREHYARNVDRMRVEQNAQKARWWAEATPEQIAYRRAKMAQYQAAYRKRRRQKEA